MKILAYLGNIAFIIFILVAAATAKRFDGGDMLILLLFLAFPIVNLIVIAASGYGKDFLSLYFERKRLEQEQKLIAIKKSMGREI